MKRAIKRKNFMNSKENYYEQKTTTIFRINLKQLPEIGVCDTSILICDITATNCWFNLGINDGVKFSS